MTPSRAMFWDRILPLSVSNQTLGRTSLPQRLAGAHLVEQLVVAYQGPGRCLFAVHHSLAAARRTPISVQYQQFRTKRRPSPSRQGGKRSGYCQIERPQDR